MTTAEILVALVKVGGVGGSLAFLWLGYRLIREEQNREVPRGILLASIGAFILAAFVFFVAGTLSEVLVRNAESILQHLFRDHVNSKITQMRIVGWHHGKAGGQVIIDFQEERFDENRFIAISDRQKVEIVVAVRRDLGRPPMQGAYEVAFGPFPFVSRKIEYSLNPAQKEALGQGQVVFTLFGVPTSALRALPQPFEPSKIQGVFVFMEATHK